jgi:hypothetical protein
VACHRQQTLFAFELATWHGGRHRTVLVANLMPPDVGCCLCVRCVDWCFVSGHHGAIFGGACVGVRERKHLCSKRYTKNRWDLLRMTARLPHNRRYYSTKEDFFLC